MIVLINNVGLITNAVIAAMILVMLVVMTETTGDFIAVGEIVDKEIDKVRLKWLQITGKYADHVLLGHVHQFLSTPTFTRASSLVGADEYAYPVPCRWQLCWRCACGAKFVAAGALCRYRYTGVCYR